MILLTKLVLGQRAVVLQLPREQSIIPDQDERAPAGWQVEEKPALLDPKLRGIVQYGMQSVGLVPRHLFFVGWRFFGLFARGHR